MFPNNPGNGNNPNNPGDQDKPNDGEVSVNPEKPSVPIDTTPETGDQSNLSLWMFLMGASFIGALLTLMILRKQAKR